MNLVGTGLFVTLLATFVLAKRNLFVVLPPFLRKNASNSITVTTVRDTKPNVDIAVSIAFLSNNHELRTLTVPAKARKAGSPYTASFNVGDDADNATITITATDHERFHTHMPVKADIDVIHVHTDKHIYRAGEIVNVRALPLTQDGAIYTGPIEFILKNPDGYNLIHTETASSTDSFVETKFELPQHLFFGEWKILAKPLAQKDRTFDVAFMVKDYNLPPFQLRAYASEGDPIERTPIFVEATYFHGLLVDGSVAIFCSTKNSSSRTPVSQGEMLSGQWNGTLDLTPCIALQTDKQSTVITVEVRDKGAGNRVDTNLEIDPFAPRFDFVPLRPVFDSLTEELRFYVQPIGSSSGDIKADFTCLDSVNRADIHLSTRVNDVVSLRIPDNWKTCWVIMARAVRVLNRSSESREIYVYLPGLIYNRSISNLIRPPFPSVSFSVGERIVVHVDRNSASDLSYMVICNSNKVVAIGRANDDGTIPLRVISKMIGKCVIYVYNASKKPTTDMLQFYVTDSCEASLVVYKKETHPYENVTLSLNGDPYGIALVRAIDDKLNELRAPVDYIEQKNWDFSMFYPPDRVSGSYTKIVNFVDIGEIKRELDTSCGGAASFYSRRFNRCPTLAKGTASCLSNICLKYLSEECETSRIPTSSTSCDPRRPGSCNVAQARPSFVSKFQKIVKMEPYGGTVLSDDFEVSLEKTVRENFHEVWLFDAYKLGASGTNEVTVQTPANIGRWSISSSFWSPGLTDLCVPKPAAIVTKKNVFMEVDIPRHVYVNETISVKITVTGLNILTTKKEFAICIAELGRQVCADLGMNGGFGKPEYTRVVISKDNPIDTKTFSIRFMAPGDATVMFVLREEMPRPGKSHCETGKIQDAVKLKLYIAERADAEYHYKQIILNPSKILHVEQLADDPGTNRIPYHSAIEYHEERIESSPNAMKTNVHIQTHDTNRVYSISVSLSKLLPELPILERRRRSKRGLPYRANGFLSDIIKQLSVELYQFKRAKLAGNSKSADLDAADQRIGSLFSELLTFGDCGSDANCGFGQYGKPKKEGERSPVLTALATSLLCQAEADEKLICGALEWIQDLVDRRVDGDRSDLNEMIDTDTDLDLRWIMTSLLMQVARDCRKLTCAKNDLAWRLLYGRFYMLDENQKFDHRSVAALAFMGTNATREIMKLKLLENMKSNFAPYWTAGEMRTREDYRDNSFEADNKARRIRSGDVAVNALGLLSFLATSSDPEKCDEIAGWLDEQRNAEGAYGTALDTYLAARALYEYQSQKVEVDFEGDLKVSVFYEGEVQEVNITNDAVEIHLPLSVRDFSLLTEGHGKVKSAVQVVLSKRMRPRRGLTHDDYYPVEITVEQRSDTPAVGTIQQIVCLRTRSPAIKTIEVTHGMFTSYTTKSSSIAIRQNSTRYLRFVSTPTVSSYAAHLMITGLSNKNILCYEVGLIEPPYSHEPGYLAPVVIEARHPINDVIGLFLLSHPAQRRKKRSFSLARKFISIHKRHRRGIVDESIDAVCFSGGKCSCAETSCNVQCGKCMKDSLESIKETMKTHFVAHLVVEGKETKELGHANYTVFKTFVSKSNGFDKEYITGKFDVWLRQSTLVPCNTRCATGATIGSNLYLIGDYSAVAEDAMGRNHYVLRNDDRLEIMPYKSLDKPDNCKDLVYWTHTAS